MIRLCFASASGTLRNGDLDLLATMHYSAHRVLKLLEVAYTFKYLTETGTKLQKVA